MTSNVDICNSALNMVGASVITALTEDTKAARVCNQRYPFVRDAVFRAHPWNCLIRRVKLGQDATAPAYKYAYRYTLPSDPYCLRVLTISDDGADERRDIDFKVEGNRYLLTDEGTVYIQYVSRDEDPNQYDVLLTEALAARMASDIAYPLVGSSALSTNLFAIYEIKLKEARFADAQEGYPDDIVADTFTSARF
ncbi:hypothetical protein CMI37_10100 [Candidatus Pacearchaeota archaeon]|nr:hypothetical protein [Candidatus Pacearchaeota archaeon]|tara:strand:- start:756 stop:1340 length:585 start_codon:yes stop_codon:yes gene_type:complete